MKSAVIFFKCKEIASQFWPGITKTRCASFVLALFFSLVCVAMVAEAVTDTSVAVVVESHTFPTKCEASGRYVIETAGHLVAISSRGATGRACSFSEEADYVLSANYVMAADIDLSGYEWTPIGNIDAGVRNVFRGTFDGGGFVISGLAQSGQNVTVGLFGKTENAEIRNITLWGADFNIRGDFGRREFTVGIVAGEMIGGTLENVAVFGGKIAVNAPEYGSGAIGGAVGKALRVRFADVRVNGVEVVTYAVRGQPATRNESELLSFHEYNRESEVAAILPLRAVGGIAGCMEDCTVSNSVALNANVRANALSAGGFAGQICGGTFTASGAEIIHVESRTTDEIGGLSVNIGGFAGLVQENAVFEKCHTTGAVRAMEGNKPAAMVAAGGFAGRVSGSQEGIGVTFTQCMAFAEVTAVGLVGGFAGRLAGRSRISHSHATGSVSSCGNAGGFVGEITNASRIEFSTAAGAVSGGQSAAGFAAIVSDMGAPNTITSSLALGNVVVGTHPETTRRFAAKTIHNGINNCYANLGMVVIAEGALQHVFPSPFGKDGGDISALQAATFGG